MAKLGLVKTAGSVLLWTVLPIVCAGASTVLGLWAANDARKAPTLRLWAIVVAVLLVILLISKAIRDRRHEAAIKSARLGAVRELYNMLGPGLDLTTEMALLASSEREKKHDLLRNIAGQCCSALAQMTLEATDVRAIVFEVLPSPDRIAPLARFGRREDARTFRLDQPEGQELLQYLGSSNPQGELYEDTKRSVPEHYHGAPDRYRTFIRAPIYANGAVFGMVAIDAPKPKTLTKGDVALAELVAAQLSVAFAIAASGTD